VACGASPARPRRRAARAEGLRDVVVGAGIEPHHAVTFARARGEHDDGHRGGGGALTQDAADLEAAEHRQVQVQHDEIGRLLARRFQRRVAARRQLDLDVAAAFEGVLDELGDIELVLDHEDAPAVGAGRRYGPQRRGPRARRDGREGRVRLGPVVGARGRRGVKHHRLTVASRRFLAVTAPLILGYGRVRLTRWCPAESRHPSAR
jgi:hypothetical protein